MSMTPGGWTPFAFELSPKQKAVFLEATKGHLGYEMEPFACSTQLVKGTNYCFLCQGKAVVPKAEIEVFKLYIVEDLGKAAVQKSRVLIKPLHSEIGE